MCVFQHQSNIFRLAYQKLASKYFGPFQVFEEVGVVAYRLALPDDSKVHPVFHVSLLKRKIGDSHTACSDLNI